MTDLTTDQKIDALYQKFVASTAPPAPVTTVNPRFFRPAADVVKPSGVYDGSEADALRFAGFGVNPVTGKPAFGSASDLESARALCDKLYDAPSATAASAIIPRAGDLDTDAALFLVMTGLTQGSGPGSFISPTFSSFPSSGTHLGDAIALLTGGGQAGVFQS